ncbi:MAG: HD domain-containing protein [Microthrixaceae bacterium]
MERIDRTGRRAERVMAALESLATVCDGGEISELDHALQVATRAERAGADDEVVLAALLHDVGKVFGDAGHPEISAAVLEPHVRSDVVEVVRHHRDFTARHWQELGAEDDDPRERHRGRSWFPLAERFVDDWDMESFDLTYAAQPLEHFSGLVERLVNEP